MRSNIRLSSQFSCCSPLPHQRSQQEPGQQRRGPKTIASPSCRTRRATTNKHRQRWRAERPTSPRFSLGPTLSWRKTQNLPPQRFDRGSLAAAASTPLMRRFNSATTRRRLPSASPPRKPNERLSKNLHILNAKNCHIRRETTTTTAIFGFIDKENKYDSFRRRDSPIHGAKCTSFRGANLKAVERCSALFALRYEKHVGRLSHRSRDLPLPPSKTAASSSALVTLRSMLSVGATLGGGKGEVCRCKLRQRHGETLL